jgi:DNA-binding MarR family transcriptional regulator
MLRRIINRRIRQRHSRRQVLVKLASIEREYIKYMKVVSNDVIKQLVRVIDEEMHEMLFVNIPEIIILHE